MAGYDDNEWMRQAFQYALQAQAQGEVPVGAVIVNEDNQLIGHGWNQVRHTHDPTAHAEVVALKQAAAKLANYRLSNATMYVTLEPCCMCAGAMIHARLKRLVFACRDFKAGAAGSVFNLLAGFPLNHQIQIDEGTLEHQCSNLLSDFFQQRR